MDIACKQAEPVFRFTVLGTRGSMPVEGQQFSHYGGSTSCYRLLAGKEEIYLDAGSGIAGIQPQSGTNISILLTHMHLDHLIGLPFFAALGNAHYPVDIYAYPRSGLATKEAIDRLTSLPFWPVTISEYPAAVGFHTLTAPDGKWSVGDVTVDMMEGSHPGGSTVFRLTRLGKSIVYATDFEHTSDAVCESLADFAVGCDLLLYDAQYTEEEYGKYIGYGHSTPTAGIQIAKAAGAKQVLFVHHAPWRSDEALNAMEREAAAINPHVKFAKIGDCVVL